MYEFTGLDYWTGLLDWIARLYSKCVDKAFREKSKILCYMEDGCWMPIHSGKAGGYMHKQAIEIEVKPTQNSRPLETLGGGA